MHRIHPGYSLLQLLIQLFTLGIFSVEGGLKAWFELILVTASLCGCGYILWWEASLIILAIILGTIALGMLSIVLPSYSSSEEVDTSKVITKPLQVFCESKLDQIDNLSSEDLSSYLDGLIKAKEIFDRHPDLLNQISTIKEIADSLSSNLSLVREEVNKNEERKREKQRILTRVRKEKGFTSGHPPDETFHPPQCPPSYPVKVTLNHPDESYDGIIWKRGDTEYGSIHPQWCFRSVNEALSDGGRYKLRRPKNSQGKLRD